MTLHELINSFLVAAPIGVTPLLLLTDSPKFSYYARISVLVIFLVYTILMLDLFTRSKGIPEWMDLWILGGIFLVVVLCWIEFVMPGRCKMDNHLLY